MFLLEWTPEKGWHRQTHTKNSKRYWRWRQELNFLEDIKFSMVSVTSGDVLIWSCKRFLIIWFDSREHAVNNTAFLSHIKKKHLPPHCRSMGWNIFLVWKINFACRECLLSPQIRKIEDLCQIPSNRRTPSLRAQSKTSATERSHWMKNRIIFVRADTP